jgi:hypothetical protein
MSLELTVKYYGTVLWTYVEDSIIDSIIATVPTELSIDRSLAAE